MAEQLIKLQSVDIYRDLAYNNFLRVVFSQQKVSVIYGANGCGKTTFLRCLSAVFAQNESILLNEKVKKIVIRYYDDTILKFVEVEKISNDKSEMVKDERMSTLLQQYDWDRFSDSVLNRFKSILFGVNRGISDNIDINEEDITNAIYRVRIQDNYLSHSDTYRLARLILRYLDNKRKSIRGRSIRNVLDLSDPSLTIDGISMDVIEDLLVERVNYAKRISTGKVIKALFDTIADACDSNSSNQEEEIIDIEYKRILLDNKDRLITALKSEENNTVIERIINILENVSVDQELSDVGQNKLLKKLICNMIRELNQESETLRPINKLMEVYNEYIGPDKYLVISEESAEVHFVKSNDVHKIEALSSGEKHLLVLLTIFVIEGYNRNLFMVDEPEISLNMEWQRKLLPLLSELAPNSEIILASHSPSIAHDNSQCLVELERNA